MKEKTADEMFKELGYEFFFEDCNVLEYAKEYQSLYNYRKFIRFSFADRSFTFFYYGCERRFYATMQELQAINKKCQELGWIE